MAYSSRTGRRVINGAAGRQSWAEGEVVNVGFVRGLEVVKRVPTPGDHAPDAYALWQPATGRFYRFVPHNGLERVDTLAEALAA